MNEAARLMEAEGRSGDGGGATVTAVCNTLNADSALHVLLLDLLRCVARRGCMKR